MPLFGSTDESIGVKITTTSDTGGIDKARNAIDGLGGRFDAVGAKTIAFGNLIAQGLTSASRSFVDLGKSAVSQTATYEQSRIAFETMLGSADKARVLMNQIADFAKTTPFELPEVVAGTKQLLAFGFAQDQLIPTMRKLGDLASGLGVPVGQLTNVFGQVRVAGRLMGQDLLQFTNAGVPLIEALATTMKQPQSEIKKLVEQGKIGFPEVEAALNSLTGEGSKFGGMMQKQSKTFSGVVSNIKDGFGQILRSAMGMTTGGDIIEGGLFDKIKGAAERTMPYVQRLAEAAGPAVVSFMEKLDGVASVMTEAAKQAADYLGPKLSHLFDVIKTNLLPALQELYEKRLKPIVPVIGTMLVGALGLAIDAFSGVVKLVSGFAEVLSNNDAAFWAFVTVMSTIATVMITKKAYSEAVEGIGHLKKGYETLVDGMNTAKDTFNTVRTVMVDTAKMVWSAVKVGTAWVVEAGKAAVAWTVSMAKTLASMALHAPKMILHAADVGLAWILNATRVSFVWVTQTMPKLVASFAATAASATVHAVTASAAWIASATRSAVAWTITEMPKIVASFIVTSAQSVVHATIASAAWIASASKSAIAWVVTEMPRIIASFAVASGAAIVHAATASAAWIASAAQSTLSFQAFSALVATPLVMPAIAIAAAVAAIAIVYNEWLKVKALQDEVGRQQNSMGQGTTSYYESLKRGVAEGRFSQQEANRRMSEYNKNFQTFTGRASGGHVQAGKTYQVNEEGLELFTPNRSGTVIPHQQTMEIIGGGKVAAGGGNTYKTNIGTVILQTAPAVDRFFERLDMDNNLTANGLSPTRAV